MQQHLTDDSQNQRRRKLRFQVGAAVVVILVAILVGGLALNQSIRKRRESQRLTKAQEGGRKVEVTEVKQSSGNKDLSLFGESRAFFSVTLFARVSGYMTDLYVDIGSQVKKGQLLARVQSPEAEQSYNSALSDAINKKRIADRYKVLLRRKLVSQQEADQAFTSSRISNATLETQTVVRDYQNVKAPFDGRITQRFVDPGALIQNASSSPSVQALFTVSQTDRLRVFIYVDQLNAASVQVGAPVDISDPHHPGEHFKAEVAQLAGELDPKTRTLLVEIHVDNHDQKIVAGSFVQVSLRVATPPYLQLPVQALVIRNGDPLVPVVTTDNKVHYRKVDLANNDGKSLFIRSGVSEGERVALNLGESVQEGQKVRPQPTGAQAGKASP